MNVKQAVETKKLLGNQVCLRSIEKYYRDLDALCLDYAYDHPTIFTEEGVVTEIDESFFGRKQKYRRGIIVKKRRRCVKIPRM